MLFLRSPYSYGRARSSIIIFQWSTVRTEFPSVMYSQVLKY